jgi:hypothetical protein
VNIQKKNIRLLEEKEIYDGGWPLVRKVSNGHLSEKVSNGALVRKVSNGHLSEKYQM